jgi:hypothetical protein
MNRDPHQIWGRFHMLVQNVGKSSTIENFPDCTYTSGTNVAWRNLSSVFTICWIDHTILASKCNWSCVCNLDKIAEEYFHKSRLSFKRFKMEVYSFTEETSQIIQISIGIKRVLSYNHLSFNLVFILILVVVDPFPATTTCRRKGT